MQTDEIEKLLAEAKPGPWIVRTLENFGWNVVHYLNGDKFKIYRVSKSNDEADARLIAMAPDLAAEVVRLRKALEEIVEPTAAMEDRLEDGERLDELMAIALAHDAGYLKSIARAVLEGRG